MAASMITPSLFIPLLITWFSHLANAKVFMILMEDDSVSSYNTKKAHSTRADADAMVYKEQLRSGHDTLLESLLEKGTYTKLYSYTHLLNGFAIHVTSEDVLSALHNATGVRAIHEDVKMEKLTTHTPDFLRLPDGVWPTLGGAETSGEGVVIGFVDTGINPIHPSFMANPSVGFANATKFRGSCTTGEQFPPESCNGKIVAAQYFAQGAIAAGDLNATRDYASPFDVDGHGSHTASTAAGNHRMPVSVNGFQYGYASGMAPGARIAVYKALYTFGGYMSDVVAAVDKAVEDGVDILSLSVGPSSVPSGPSVFLNVLEVELLFATKAGVLVVQAAGNGGPSFGSILSFSPWITTVAASTTDRKYTSTIMLGNGHSYSGAGLAPSTAGEGSFPIAAAADVSYRNNSDSLEVANCRHPEFFISTLARGKLIICTYTFNLEYEAAGIATVADTIDRVGAAGVIMTMDPTIVFEQVKGTTMTLQVPAIILNDLPASSNLWRYYNANTVRSRTGRAVVFRAKARILDGRQATYSQHAPVVAFYSSRGPDVNNAVLQTVDVLKPNVMAPGSSIWAAWSPSSGGDPNIKGQNFALVTGTSMATPHIAGVAALIKQRHPRWGPAAITSAMMTSADVFDHSGSPILAQLTNRLAPATPFDLGAGFINPTRAIDPGLIFNAHFEDYVRFLCDVPGVNDESVRRALGIKCPPSRGGRCSDLNTASIAVSNLVGWRKVARRVSNVSNKTETYRVSVKEPFGVRVIVTPQVLGIRGHGSRHLRIILRAIRATRAYTFGEIILHGSRKHVVRLPIAVYVSSLF